MEFITTLSQTIQEKLKNPAIAAIVALVVGVLLGLFWGYQVDPVVWRDTAPELLNANYKNGYVRMTIDSLVVNSDPNLALERWKHIGEDARQILAEIKASPGAQSQKSIDAFELLVNTVATETSPETAPPEETGMSSTVKYGLIAFALVFFAVIGYLIMRLLRPSIAKGGEATPAQKAAQISQSAQQTDYSELGLATPITQSMTTYVLGDDLYDESFSIESQAGEFMGEYGVGISDTIGVGDPKKVSALEIWLFDKNDIKTATKVLMSEHAYNDPAIRQRLEAKGELVVIQNQNPVRLETETLQLLVTVADLEYGTGPLPPGSYFDRTTLELAIWPKNNG